MIAAVHFQNFKALRSAAIRLEAFNLFIGPSGSGKTSLIQALLRLRTLAGLPVTHARDLHGQRPAGPRIEFHFAPPFQDTRVTLGCNADEMVCNLLVVEHAPATASQTDPTGEAQWADLRTRLQSIRGYLFDHFAMAVPSKRTDAAELASNAGNVAAVLAKWREQNPVVYRAVEAEFCRQTPEFAALEFRDAGTGLVELAARPVDGGGPVPAESLAQGTLYLLALLTLAFAPRPPAVVCLEEADRGLHPRMLREVRDLLHRLSYPKEFGVEREPAQVIATTHSPYLLDLFKEHPDEVVLAQKRGRAATFERLSERADLKGLLAEAHLGDLWYSGVLGGVPEE